MVRDYIKFLPNDRDFNDFLTEFQNESERAAAILAATYIDELLADLLRASFIDDEATVSRLLDDLDVLGTLRSRTEVAYAAGLLSVQERRDSGRVREIRNRFAHRRHGLTFATAEIADRCRAFEVVEERFQAEPALQRVYPQAPRELFNLATALLSYYLIRRIENAQRAPNPTPALWPELDLRNERR